MNDKEEKRLLRNVARRKRYAQLKEEKSSLQSKPIEEHTLTKEKASHAVHSPIDEEEKRLRKNMAQRKRYAELKEQKRLLHYKQIEDHPMMIAQNTATTNVSAEAMQSNTNTAKRNWDAEFSKDNHETALQRMKETYTMEKGKALLEETTLRSENTHTCQQIPKIEQARHNSFSRVNITESNGQSKRGFHNSFEIGSSSSHASDRRQMRHATAATCLQTNNDTTEVQDKEDADTGSAFAKWTTRQRTQSRKGRNKSNVDVLKNIVSKADTLPAAHPCKYCAAKRFNREPKGFCCADGEIALISADIPEELYELFTSSTDDASHFRTYVRTYNNTFAFTSFGVKYDKDLCKRNKGIYTFKVQGQVYHYINELSPTGNPSYLQLYFYDTEHEVDNRMTCSPTLKPSVLEKIIDILKINPYVAFFRRLTDITDMPDQHIILKANSSLDQRVYNCPKSSEVAAIWFENTESLEREGRDIIVYNHIGYHHKVQYYYGCYDPLQYPLLFPYGQSGWHQGIERASKGSQMLCGGQLLINPVKTKSAEEILKQEEKSQDEESNIVDEIQDFQSARWVSTAEAMWRIYRFALNEMHPSVQSLHLHLEG